MEHEEYMLSAQQYYELAAVVNLCRNHYARFGKIRCDFQRTVFGRKYFVAFKPFGIFIKIFVQNAVDFYSRVGNDRRRGVARKLVLTGGRKFFILVRRTVDKIVSATRSQQSRSRQRSRRKSYCNKPFN